MQDMMLKTPTAMDAEIGSPKIDQKSGDSGCLAQEIMGGYAVILPTPTAMDSTEATARMKSSQTKDGSMHSVTLARAVQSQDSKDGRASQLNPLFVGELHKAISDHMAKVADTNVVTDKFKQYLKDDFEFPKFTPENFDGMANTLIDGIFE